MHLLMKNKHEVFSKFKEFKALIENHTEKKVKTFWSDNGGEFTSNEFYAKTRGLRGSCSLLTIHNRMGLQKGILEPSWKLQEQCFMIKIFLCIYGKKHLEQWCMYRTVLHTEYWRTRHLKKSFPIRNQKSSISEYLDIQCTYTFQKRKRKKLDPSGKKGIFVGYSKNSKAYITIS